MPDQQVQPSPASTQLVQGIAEPAHCSLDEMEARVRRMTNELNEMLQQCAAWKRKGMDTLFDEEHPEVRPRVDNLVTQRLHAMHDQLTDILRPMGKLRLCVRDTRASHQDVADAIAAAGKPLAKDASQT